MSPELLRARDLELAVPGTYKAGEEVVRIKNFSPILHVITSKQRPRKITMTGSDGRDYVFLLKVRMCHTTNQLLLHPSVFLYSDPVCEYVWRLQGHEDLRQDERVMQLFGLVNALLAGDPDTSKRDLSVKRYAVTPLSHNVGVVGWVPFCDTLHRYAVA